MINPRLTKIHPIIAKSHPLFAEEIKKIQHERVLKGLDKKIVGRHIIERKMLKTKAFADVIAELRVARFMPDNDAFLTVFNWFTFLVVAFLAIILFAGLIYVMGLINGAMHNAGLSNEVNAGKPGYVNMTQISDNTFGKVNESIQGLRLVALTLIFSLIVGNIIVNFLVKVHPVWFFVYVLIVIFAVLLAAPISNAYQSILNDPTVFGGILPTFNGANWVMINLPIVVAVAGILGGVFLFVNVVRSPNESGSLQ